MQNAHNGHKEVSAKRRQKAGFSTASGPSPGNDVTRIYLSEIGRTRLLTADEEKSLSRAAQAGCSGCGTRAQEWDGAVDVLQNTLPANFNLGVSGFTTNSGTCGGSTGSGAIWFCRRSSSLRSLRAARSHLRTA